MRVRTLTPGPGTYSPGTQDRAPGWSVGKDKKVEPTQYEKASAGIPRPGTYSASKDLDGPKWSIRGKTASKQERVDSPGPGAYEPLPTIGNLPHYARPN